MSRNIKRSYILRKIYKVIIISVIILIVMFSLYRNSGLFYRKGIILPFSLHLNRQEIYLIKGEEFRLFVYGLIKGCPFIQPTFVWQE